MTIKPALHHYEKNTQPPTSRVDLRNKPKPRKPLGVWDVWKVGAMVATKATELTTEVLSHGIWGPRRKSWGIEMTVVTTLMRGIERNSALVDIGTIRRMMSLGGLVPLPSDALITPVTFTVPKRQLRGILAEYDALEDGTRELSGEWVVGRKTWHRMQQEWKAAKEATQSGETPPLKRKERVVLYIHGGAYYFSSSAAQRVVSIPLAKHTDSRVFALDYRLAPETVFPGSLHDAATAYFRLVDDLKIRPENILVAGDSAGGGLTLALLMYLRDNAYPLPAGAILMSPWVDLTMSCESWDTNAATDIVPLPSADNHMHPIALYLGDKADEYLTHPYCSPLFGDFTGLPPLLISAGDAEVLRDEITLLAHKATRAGVKVTHELYEDAIHIFVAYPFLDAAKQAFVSMKTFADEVIPRQRTGSPRLVADGITESPLTKELTNERAFMVDGDGTATVRKDGKGLLEDDVFSDSVTELAGESDPSWVPSPWLRPSLLRWDSEKPTQDIDPVEDRDHLPSTRSRANSIAVPAPELRPLSRNPSMTSLHSASSPRSPNPLSPSPRRSRSSASLGSLKEPRTHDLFDIPSPDHSHVGSPTPRRRNHARTPSLLSSTMGLTMAPIRQEPEEEESKLASVDPLARRECFTSFAPQRFLDTSSTLGVTGQPKLRDGHRVKKRKDLGLSVRALIGIKRQVEEVEPIQFDASEVEEMMRSMVEDWKHAGPANETRVFAAKPVRR